MRPRRVTVHFGAVRVVVPMTQEKNRISDLGKAAVARYCRATGENEDCIRVYRLELSQGGILDWDDIVDEVLNDDTDQILAIYDDDSCPQASSSVPSASSSRSVPVRPSSHSHQMSTSGSSVASHSSSPMEKLRSPVLGRVRDSVVEITSLENPPTSGLRVSSTSMGYARPATAVDNLVCMPLPLRSSLRTEDRKHTPPRTINRVTMSPDVEKKLSLQEEAPSRSQLQRSSARKSRLTDSFFDAKDRLEDRRRSLSPPEPKSERRLGPCMPADNPEHTVIVFPDDDKRAIGIEVTAVMDEVPTNGKLPKMTSVQIAKISDDGRVGLDGRLRVGDNIVEIDGRPVYQMSLDKAKDYLLNKIGEKSVPTLTIARPISSFLGSDHKSEASTSSGTVAKRPILSALQQANTQQIGQTKTVAIKKLPGGFGFTVTGRETARGERLFYIGTVKIGGAAVGLLKAGDRLLKINGESTSGLRQNDVVNRLKEIKSGGTAELEISRVSSEEQENTPPEENHSAQTEKDNNREDFEDEAAKRIESTAHPPDSPPAHRARMVMSTDGITQVQELEFLVPLNDTGSAGLGISLKARVLQLNEGGRQIRQDRGLFVKKLLVGGAAWKDGRLAVDDQLCGIEDVDLLKFARNSEASEAVTSKLKEIGPNASFVKLRVARKHPPHGASGSQIIVDGADSTILLDGSETPLESLRRERYSGDSTLLTALEHQRHSSTTSNSTRKSEVMEDDVLPNPEAFDREATTRKSMSEKRGMGASTDPSSTATFQKIKHQRQTSAPNMPISRSFHGRSASQRAQARARSQSVHPREPAKDIRKQSEPREDAPESPDGADDSPRRRSKSVDVNRINGVSTSTPTVHEMVAASSSQSSEYGNSIGFKNPSFKHAIENDAGYYGNAGYSPVVVPRNADHLREKEKQQRRKSVGSTMKNWFRIGSRSREVSPEKSAEEIRRRQEEEKRIEDLVRAREAAYANHVERPPLRNPRVYSEYEPPIHQPTNYEPEPPLLSPDSFSVANSRFYRSLGPRSVPARTWQAHPPSTISGSSTGTNTTDGRESRSLPLIQRAMSIREETTPISHLPTMRQSQAPTPITEHHLEVIGSNTERLKDRIQTTVPEEVGRVPHRPTTMHSMRGSPIVEEAAWEFDQPSRPHSLAEGGSPLLLNPRPQKVVRGRSREVSTPNRDGHGHTPTTSPPISTEVHRSRAPSTTNTEQFRRATATQGTSTRPIITPIFPGSKVFFAPSSMSSSDRISMRNSRRKYRKGVQSACIESEAEKERRDSNVPSNWHSIPIQRSAVAPLPPSETQSSSIKIRSKSSSYRPLQDLHSPSTSSNYRISPAMVSPSDDVPSGFSRKATYHSTRVTTRSSQEPPPGGPQESFSTVLSNWQNRAKGAESLPSRSRTQNRPQLRSDTFRQANGTDF